MQSPEPLAVPSANRPEFAEEARRLALARTSDENLTRYFEIPLVTLRRPELERFATMWHDSGTRAGRKR